MPFVEMAISELEVDSSYRVSNRVGGGPQLRLDRSALRELEFQIREGVRAINGHGIEIGGLVTGSELDWNSSEVVITGFIPVGIEYRFGPAYRPSEIDLAILKEAAANAGHNVIGYFRSQLRDQTALRAEDTRLLSELFPESDCCFIRVRASSKTSSNAEFFHVRAGGNPLLFEVFALKESEPVQPIAPPRVEPTAPAAVAPAVDQGALTVRAKPQLRPLLIFAGIATIFLISAAAYSIGRSTVRVPPPVQVQESIPVAGAPQDPKLGLKLTEIGRQLEVSWNPAVPAVSTAVRGRLMFAGKPTNLAPGNVELSAVQISSGLYVYKLSGNKVTVMLMIYQPDGSFTGETKEFTSARPAPVPPVPKQRAAAPQTRVIHMAAAKRTKDPAPQSPPVLEPPTAGVTDTPGVALLALALPAASPPTAATPAPPSVSYQVGSAPSARLLAPRLVHQASPSVPPGIASRIRSEVRIEVAVTVDADGKVTGAHVLSSQGAAAGLLAIEALKAAQFCRFLPAQQDGKPAPGSAVVTFRFAPGPN